MATPTTGIYDSFGKGWGQVSVRGPHWETVLVPGKGTGYICYDRPLSAFDPPDLPPPRPVDILWRPAPKPRRKPG